MEKREVIEEFQCNVEAEEHLEVPVTFIELMREDEEIYKKLKNPMGTRRDAINIRK